MPVKKQDPGGCNCTVTCATVDGVPVPLANLQLTFTPPNSGTPVTVALPYLGVVASTFPARCFSGSNPTWDTGWFTATTGFSTNCDQYRFVLQCSGVRACLSALLCNAGHTTPCGCVDAFAVPATFSINGSGGLNTSVASPFSTHFSYSFNSHAIVGTRTGTVFQ